MFRQLTLLAPLVGLVLSASWSSYGCFHTSDASALTLNNQYTFQSSGACETNCSNLGNAVVGLFNGQYCYCGNSVPSDSLQVDLTNCNVPCDGYDKELCGGSQYFLIYTDSSKSIQTQAAGSSSSPSSKTSSTSSTATSSSSTSTTSSSSTSSTTPSSTSSSSTASASTKNTGTTSSNTDSKPSSAGVITLVSTVTDSPSNSASVISITTTEASSASPTNNSNNSNNNDTQSKSKGLSGGAIAGIVVGAIAGVLLIIGLIVLFIWWKKRQEYEDDADEFTLSGGDEKNIVSGGNYNINSNPFMNQQNPNTGAGPGSNFSGGYRGAGLAGAGAGAGAGMGAGASAVSRGNSRLASGSGNHYDHDQLNSNSLLDHDEEYFLFDRPKVDITGEANRESSEFGRRRLSNGSLPDMVTRNPGSLKVVNN